jgi:hypothetical protein
MSLWLTASASAGSSFKVGINDLAHRINGSFVAALSLRLGDLGVRNPGVLAFICGSHGFSPNTKEEDA